MDQTLKDRFKIKQVNWKAVLSVVVAVAAYLILSRLPLQAYGDKTASALGFFAAFLILMFAQPWDMFLTAMLVPIGGFLLGFWDWRTFQVSAGTSSFLQVMAFSIVGLGAETTPLGKRLAYWFLKRFGQKPVLMVVTVGVVSGLISSMISNTATLIMMSAIVHEMLVAMGETPGTSRIGRCLMLLISAVCFIGGAALYNGCVFVAALGLDLLKSAAGGVLEGMTLSYREWAILGFPTFAVTIIPICLIYAFTKRVSAKGVRLLPKEHYEEKLREMGRIQYAEVRWIITVVCMIVLLVRGANTNTTSLIFAIITLMPLIGTVPIKGLFSKLPMHIFFVLYFTSILGELFTTTGLSNMLADLVYPYMSDLQPYVFSAVVFLIMVVIQNVLINGSVAGMSLVLTISTPICLRLGYNPFVILFPAICAASYFFWIPLGANMLLNKGYGWWTVKDSLLPGGLTLLFLTVVAPAITLWMAPLAGLSIYMP